MQNKGELLLASVSRNDLSESEELLEAGADPDVVTNTTDDEVCELCM